MKEFGERAAGSTALLHWWNEAELRQRPHSPARLRALCDVLRVRRLKASSGSLKPCCGGVLTASHNRSPFAIKT